MSSNESWKSNAKKASGGNTLKTRGVSQKGKGLPQGHSYKADNNSKALPNMGDRGPGSSTAFALLREEATRLRSLRKVPGNLGYQGKIDVSKYGKYSCTGKSGKK